MAWQLDPHHSSFEFSVKHMVVATVRGRFRTFNVTADIDEQDITKSKASVIVDVGSIDTREEGRDNHLKSPDFFDAEKFPQITYVTKRIESKGGNEYRLVGDLTIHGTTNETAIDGEVSGPIKDPYGNERLGISGEGRINRKEFGLNWNGLLEAGGAVVSDQVRLHIEVELIKPPAA